MKERVHANGRFVALAFYTLLGIVIVIAGGMYTGISLVANIIFTMLLITSTAVLLSCKPGKNIKFYRYEILQSIFFIMEGGMFFYMYRSFNMLLFMLFLQSFLMMLFQDETFYYFQLGVIAVIVLAVVIINLINFPAVMMKKDHLFGMLCLCVVQWVCINIVQVFNNQTRHMAEQEQGLDDMLRILEVKCLEARRAVESKSEFLSNMSHEIRTPINSVIGMNEMILRECKDRDILTYATNIDNSGKMLLSLVNDLLEFSNIESGKVDIVPSVYKTTDFINELFGMVLIPAREKGIGLLLEIDNRIPQKLYGDDVRFCQVVANLMTNAVKYTEEGTVTLRMEVERTDHVKVVLRCEVRDTGIGIREEQIPHLFTVFKEEDVRKKRKGLGAGLGLPISYHLLSAMGSELKVESVYGAGSVFSFSLEQDIVDETPVEEVMEQIRNHTVIEEHHGNLYAPEAKVLVVDDNEMNRKVFVNLLKEAKITVDQAESGEKCLEMLDEKNHMYDVIFLDHMMPGMDGIETLSHIRKKGKEYQQIPIIALTANVVSGAREMYLVEGFDEFLSKPVMPDKLEKVLTEFLPGEMVSELLADGGEKDMELPITDGVDWNFAMLHFPDKKMLLHTLEDFNKMIMYEAEKLENFLLHITEEGQMEEFQIQVHGMKSAAALVGIIPLSGAAKMLEDAAKRKDIEMIMSMAPFFLREWREYKDKLAPVCNPETDFDDKKEDDMELLALMGMLQGAADGMDIDTMDEIVGKLSAYRLPEGTEGLLCELEAAVINLDNDTIASITDEFGIEIRKKMKDRR